MVISSINLYNKPAFGFNPYRNNDNSKNMQPQEIGTEVLKFAR